MKNEIQISTETSLLMLEFLIKESKDNSGADVTDEWRKKTTRYLYSVAKENGLKTISALEEKVMDELLCLEHKRELSK